MQMEHIPYKPSAILLYIHILYPFASFFVFLLFCYYLVFLFLLAIFDSVFFLFILVFVDICFLFCVVMCAARVSVPRSHGGGHNVTNSLLHAMIGFDKQSDKTSGSNTNVDITNTDNTGLSSTNAAESATTTSSSLSAFSTLCTSAVHYCTHTFLLEYSKLPITLSDCTIGAGATSGAQGNGATGAGSRLQYGGGGNTPILSVIMKKCLHSAEQIK